MVRNRSLFVWLLVVACLAPPAMAGSRSANSWLAQADIDNPDAVDDPDAPDDLDAPLEATPEPPADTAPAAPVDAPDMPLEATPAPPADTAPAAPTGFVPPEQLPEGTNLTIEGSSSMAVITQALIQQFQAAYPNASVTLTEQPADVALTNLQTATADLAAIGRPLTEEQLAQNLREVSISREKVAVIVSADNPFEDQLEAADFVRIFRGEITNWVELGGPDLPIRLVDRPATSDTRAALGNYEIFDGDLTTGDNVTQVPSDSTAEVVEALGDNGIGYAIASQVIGQDNVRVLSMHGTLPDDPRYPYSQPRNYVYRGTDTLPIEVEAFLALATNAQGQETVAQAKAAEAADVAAAELPDKVSAMRPNGQGFVTGDRAGNLNFWNADGTPAGDPVAAHTGPVTALAFSADGQRLISGGADGTIRLWDAVGTPIGDPINAGNGPVTSLTIQPDGRFISASADGTLQLWDDTGNPIGGPITGHEDAVRDMVLNPDGTQLTTASKDGTIRQWNTADGMPQGEPWTGHQGAVQALAAKPDGTFVSGGADGTVRQWDASGTPVGEPLPVSGPVTAIAANASGTSVAVGDDTGALQYLSGEGVPVGPAITDVGAPIDDLAFTPDGQRLVVSAGAVPQLRDSTGQSVPIPTAEAETADSEAAGLPPELLDLWQRLRQLPPQVLWIIPVVVLGLLLLGLLRSFRQDEDDDFDEEPVNLLPGDVTEADTDFTNTDLTNSDLTGDDFASTDFTSPDPSRSEVSGISPQEATSSLDASLARAKQTLAEGVSLGNAGRYQEALDRFNKSIELADIERLKAAAAGTALVGASAVIARGLARRGTAFANLGRTDDALQSINRALEMDPNEAAAWIGKGNVLVQKGQLDEALFCFDKAIELNPNLAAAWQGKGKALQKMGRDAEARNAFAQAGALGGVSEDIPIELGTPVDEMPTTEYPPTGFSGSDFSSDDFSDSDFAVPSITPSSPSPGVGSIRPAAPPPTIQPQPQPTLITPPPVEPSPLPTPPIPNGPIGPIGIIPAEPTPTPGTDDDLPADLLAAIDRLPPVELPVEPAQSPPRAPITSMSEVTEPVIAPSDDSVPPDVLQAVEYLPAEAESPDPGAPVTAPIDVPPEVRAILAGDSDIPSAEETADAASITDPMSAFFGDDPTMSMRPAAQTSPPSVAEGASVSPSESLAPSTVPDQPDDSSDSDAAALAGLPPEVLEALKGIPEDSPDSFDLPSTPNPGQPPPPPPNNPRLQDPS
ncbi:MAG: substrate-binding domain-containing protein [Cyanobacteria bacterium J06626_4]